MVNGTCGNCRFKGPAVLHHVAPTGHGTLVATATGYFVCMAMRQLGAVRVGAGDASAQGPAQAFEVGAGAGVADRSGHGASLCVTDDFGCNRWQPASVGTSAHQRPHYSERRCHSTNGGS